MDQTNPRTSSSSSSKPDRKTVEKNRRNQMKNLFTHLNSLLPHHHGSTSRENMSLPGQIEEATKYIKKMQAQIERLKEKKSSLLISSSSSNSNNSAGCSNLQQRSNSNTNCGLKQPQIEVHLAGDSALQIVLITGVDCQFIFTEALRVLHDEAAEVVNASFSVMDESTVYHTIHAKIEECSEHQVAIARITERLNRVCN